MEAWGRPPLSSQDQGEVEQHPVPKVASPTQSTLSLRHLESIFPLARDSCGVGVLSLSFLLAPDLPAAFQPNISALLFVLLFVSVVPCQDLVLYL